MKAADTNSSSSAADLPRAISLATSGEERLAVYGISLATLWIDAVVAEANGDSARSESHTELFQLTCRAITAAMVSKNITPADASNLKRKIVPILTRIVESQ